LFDYSFYGSGYGYRWLINAGVACFLWIFCCRDLLLPEYFSRI